MATGVSFGYEKIVTKAFQGSATPITDEPRLFSNSHAIRLGMRSGEPRGSRPNLSLLILPNMAAGGDVPIKDIIEWKRGILRSRKIFEATGTVPSPSKDFCQILVTEAGVVWRKWKITLRNVQLSPTPPAESVMTYEDFQYDKTLHFEVELIFGKKVLDHVQRIIRGCNDPLSSLPEDILIKIAAYLDLQSVSYLSQVNQRLREVANSDSLWEKLYSVHQGRATQEVKSLASEIGWKKVFFMNKLQLQKEISRRRRVAHPSEGRSEEFSSTFLTQQVED